MSVFIADPLGLQSHVAGNFWVPVQEELGEKFGDWAYAHAVAGSSIFANDSEASARRFVFGRQAGCVPKLADLVEVGSSTGHLGPRSLQSDQLPRSTPETFEGSRKMDALAVRRRILGFLKHANLDEADAAERLQKAAHDALVFILLLPKNLPLPNASSYSDDGEVVLRWGMSDKKAEVAFLGGDEVEYTYHTNGRYVPGRAHAQPTRCPYDLEEYLTV